MKQSHATTILRINALLRRISHLMARSLPSEARGLTFVVDEHLATLPPALADWLAFNRVFPAYVRAGIGGKE